MIDKSELTLKVSLVMFAVWMIDLVSTWFALKNPNIYETNPRANFFFQMGLEGWILWSVIVFLFIIGLTSFIIWAMERIYFKLQKEKLEDKHLLFLMFIFVLAWSIGELYAIVNNLGHIIT